MNGSDIRVENQYTSVMAYLFHQQRNLLILLGDTATMHPAVPHAYEHGCLSPNILRCPLGLSLSVLNDKMIILCFQVFQQFKSMCFFKRNQFQSGREPFLLQIYRHVVLYNKKRPWCEVQKTVQHTMESITLYIVKLSCLSCITEIAAGKRIVSSLSLSSILEVIVPLCI